MQTNLENNFEVCFYVALKEDPDTRAEILFSF